MKNIFLFITLLFSLIIQAQDITIRVVTPQGKPLAKISIEDLSGQKKVVTDKNGYAQLSDATLDRTIKVGGDNRAVHQKVFKTSANTDTLIVKLIPYINGHIRDFRDKGTKKIDVELIQKSGNIKMKTDDGYFYFANVDVDSDVILKIRDPKSANQNKDIKLRYNVNSSELNYKLEQYISPALTSSQEQEGIVYMNDSTPQLWQGNDSIFSATDVDKLKKKGDKYMLKTRKRKDPMYYQIEYRGGLSISTVGRTPKNHNETTATTSLRYTDDNNIDINKYAPTDIFRTAWSFNNSLSIRSSFVKDGILRFMFNQNRINSSIPHACKDGYNASFNFENIKLKHFTTSAGIWGRYDYNNLPNIGASYSRLMHSIFTLPFYSPQEGFGPHDLLNQLPDRIKNGDVMGYAKTTFQKNRFSSDASITYNYKKENQKIGKLALNKPMDILTRKEKLSDLSVSITPTYQIMNYPTIKLESRYTFNHLENEVRRMEIIQTDRIRNSHEVSYGASYFKDKIYLDMYNKHYFSNTTTDYANIFPSIGAKLNLDHFNRINDFFYNLIDRDVLDYIGLRASFSRSLGEAPFIYRNLAVLTTTQTSSDALRTYYEDYDIFPQAYKMKPEIYQNNEIGLDMRLFNNKFSLDFTYHNNTIHNFFAPIAQNTSFVLENIGRVNNYGFYFNAGYHLIPEWSYYRVKGNFNFTFNHLKNKVKSVSGGREMVQLAGFSNIGAYFVKDEPVGVIYGSTYKKTEQGEIVTDNDGHPIKDATLRKIGDPTPDYSMGFSSDISWRRFGTSVQFEYFHGGDKWNGTQAHLDYYGGTGSLNNGIDEIGEEYIQDASFLRMSNISFNYLLVQRGQSNLFEEVSFMLSGENLLYFSPYKGVDATSTLFGYSGGKGLDLFNSPSIRRFNFVVTAKF